MTDTDALHLRSHAEGVCRDYQAVYDATGFMPHTAPGWDELYAYSLDILCLMALTEALGLEYGEFVN